MAPRSQEFRNAGKKTPTVKQSQESASKRPRRSAARANIDYDKDPYIYSGIVANKSSNLASALGRRNRRNEPNQEAQKSLNCQPDITKVSDDLEAAHSLRRRPHNNLFPPVDFGARLLGSLSDAKPTSPQANGRRRAFTEINELLVSDALKGQALQN